MSKIEQEKFDELIRKWKEETCFMSSAQQMCEHPAYREIVRAGRDVLPFIIREMRVQDTYFLWHALYEILGKGPHIPKYARGKLACVQQMWIAWYEYHYENKPPRR